VPDLAGNAADRLLLLEDAIKALMLCLRKP
jgi:hypothetical protein